MEGKGDAAIMRRQLVARARGAAHSLLASLSETEKNHLFRSPGQLCLAVGQTPPPRGGVVSESDVDVILTRAVHRATNQTIRTHGASSQPATCSGFGRAARRRLLVTCCRS